MIHCMHDLFSTSFHGCNYSCYLASLVSSKPDFHWTDFVTDDPTGSLPKEHASSSQKPTALFPVGSEHKSALFPNFYKPLDCLTSHAVL